MELKYLLPDRSIPQLIDRMLPYTQFDPYLVEEGEGRQSYPVLSLYFDSIDLHSLKEKEAGLLSRRKVRLRTYHEEFSERKPSFIEIKRRHDFVVSKDRLSLAVGHLRDDLPMSRLMDHLLEKVDAKEEVTAEAHILQGWFNLQPTALVRYKRAPFVGRQDRRFRITIDSQLAGRWHPSTFMGEQILHSCHPGFSVVELKCNHDIPAWFHEIVQDLQLERIAHSKYALIVDGLRESMRATEDIMNAPNL